MPKQTKEALTEEELNSVLEFANGLYNNGMGFFNPFSSYDLQIGNLGKSVRPTTNDLDKALESYPYDYRKLAEYSAFYQTFDAIYNKTIRYLISLLSFDISYQCINIKDPKDYKSQPYKDDVKRMWKFLDKFDCKSEFSKVLKVMLVRDACYCWFRDSHAIDDPIDINETAIKRDEHFGLQIMPQDYCQASGYFNNSNVLYDLDMNYFLNPSVDINLYSPAIKEMFRKAYNDKENDYKPSSKLPSHNGKYCNFVQCNPLKGAWCFKMDTTSLAPKPPLISMLRTCMRNGEVEDLQKQKDMISAYMLIAGEIPLLSTDKSGNKADQFAINPKTMGNFMSLVSSGLNKAIKPLALPLQDLISAQYKDENPDLQTKQLSTSSASGVSASTLIYTTDKMAQFEMQMAIESDYAFVSQAYSQFESFLNFFVNRKLKKYHFNFSLSGLERSYWKEQKTTQMRNLSDRGITLPPQYWAGCCSIPVQDFCRALEEASNGDMQDNLVLLLNANTMKDGSISNEGGAPSKSATQRSDKTEEVYDSN